MEKEDLAGWVVWGEDCGQQVQGRGGQEELFLALGRKSDCEMGEGCLHPEMSSWCLLDGHL